MPKINLFSDESRGSNLKINLYGDESESENLGDDFTELTLLASTVTDSESKFYFNNITDFTNLVVSFEGNDFFNPSDIKLKNIKPNVETKIVLTIRLKDEEYIEIEKEEDDPSPKPNKYCVKKDSNETNIFGLGFYEEKTYLTPNSILKFNKDKLISNANKVGMLDAFNDYLSIYPNEKITAEKMLEAMNKEESNVFKKPKYRIICKRIFSEKGNFVSSTVVKFKKKHLDNLVEFLLIDPEPKKEPFEFDQYDFQKALELSYDLKRKIFLFVCSDTNTECNDILQEFLNLKSIKEKFKFYIKLYYQVNRNETKKFVLASESLNIDTFPTMVILEANKDPRTNPIKNSVKLIKKITEFNNLEENINNLLS